MKKFFFCVSILAIILIQINNCLTVDDINKCWQTKCIDTLTTCGGIADCKSTFDLMNKCGSDRKGNFKTPTAQWNETLWEFCLYEETPATIHQEFKQFTNCHCQNCTSNNCGRKSLDLN